MVLMQCTVTPSWLRSLLLSVRRRFNTKNNAIIFIKATKDDWKKIKKGGKIRLTSFLFPWNYPIKNQEGSITLHGAQTFWVDRKSNKANKIPKTERNKRLNGTNNYVQQYATLQIPRIQTLQVIIKKKKNCNFYIMMLPSENVNLKYSFDIDSSRSLR